METIILQRPNKNNSKALKEYADTLYVLSDFIAKETNWLIDTAKLPPKNDSKFANDSWLFQKRESNGRFGKLKGQINKTACFHYPSSKFPYSDLWRNVDVKEETDEYIFGNEITDGYKEKKFLKRKIKGNVEWY